MTKILGLGAVGLFIPAAIASTAIASVAMLSPAVALSDPGTPSSAKVVGEPYFKAVSILKSQGLRATFGGSFGSDLPQSQCIVSQQKVTSKSKMILMLDCTKAAGQQAAADAPAAPAPGVTSGGGPSGGQGTYGGPIGVPVPVG
ncbi:MAG: hypothetical protein M3O32_08835 [Actinomycetota bacterium]|nr:hypothetical protein [Actinomycetota bacterium]